jgi:hypothetical protein
MLKGPSKVWSGRPSEDAPSIDDARKAFTALQNNEIKPSDAEALIKETLYYHGVNHSVLSDDGKKSAEEMKKALSTNLCRAYIKHASEMLKAIQSGQTPKSSRAIDLILIETKLRSARSHIGALEPKTRQIADRMISGMSEATREIRCNGGRCKPSPADPATGCTR